MSEFDYVIVGAGAAGCSLANRLTQGTSGRVCILEAGGHDYHPFIKIPAGFVKTLYSGNFAWPFKTEGSRSMGGRQVAIPQGRVVGGSSSINGMVYNRGQRRDFDTWAQFGNKGWGFEDLLPYFRRSERRIGPGDEHSRGRAGELPVTDPDWINPLCEAFIAAAEGAGIPRNPDYNSGTQFGVGYYQRVIYNGRRVSAADAYLRPAIARGRTELRTHAHVQALVFEGKRAVGVRYRDGHGDERLVRARREVIVSAGAVNSPKLLQISGLGPPQLLHELGVRLVKALPGVGENLRDHYSLRIVARARNVKSINQYGRWPRLPLEVAKWFLGRPSVLTLSPSVVYLHGKSHPGVEDSDLRILFTPGSYKEGMTYVLDDYPGMTCGAAQPRPESVGHVRARSRDPLVAPAVQPNYLEAEADQQVMLAGVRLVRQIFARPEFAQYFDEETLPGRKVHGDDELLDFARRRGNTGYHLCGTNKMGPVSDALAVVDDRLRVHGMERLRVVDASIMPMLPSANTYASTLAIAEKASDLIKADWPD